MCHGCHRGVEKWLVSLVLWVPPGRGDSPCPVGATEVLGWALVGSRPLSLWCHRGNGTACVPHVPPWRGDSPEDNLVPLSLTP